jgi:hypothetical protein
MLVVSGKKQLRDVVTSSFCRRTPELKDRDAIPLSLEGKKYFETELAVYKMIHLFLENNCFLSKDLRVIPMSSSATSRSEWPISELDEQVDSIRTSLKQVLPSCNNGMSSLSFIALSEMNAHQINIKCSCSRPLSLSLSSVVASNIKFSIYIFRILTIFLLLYNNFYKYFKNPT